MMVFEGRISHILGSVVKTRSSGPLNGCGGQPVSWNVGFGRLAILDTFSIDSLSLAR